MLLEERNAWRLRAEQAELQLEASSGRQHVEDLEAQLHQLRHEHQAMTLRLEGQEREAVHLHEALLVRFPTRLWVVEGLSAARPTPRALVQLKEEQLLRASRRSPVTRGMGDNDDGEDNDIEDGNPAHSADGGRRAQLEADLASATRLADQLSCVVSAWDGAVGGRA
jgi:hypothetical protein